ncbi:MAG TPA: TIGR03936 family radical SAM-associated protein [Longilinea sp.]|nr:TIGR03936 family radical SAM-associated protein [Longilinea sp.]
MIRIRITHTKTGALRYTGNLDMQKVWERTFRRARLPLAYSQGFHPQPRINQACPLPLGFSSTVELLDFWLNEPMPLQDIRSAIELALPGGVSIHKIEEVDQHAPALQTQVDTSEYIIILRQDVNPLELEARVTEVLSASSLPRERRGKMYDLRPLIMAMRIVSNPDLPILLHLTLTVREGATGRPEEVLSALGLDPYKTSIERTQLHLKPSQPLNS